MTTGTEEDFVEMSGLTTPLRLEGKGDRTVTSSITRPLGFSNV